MFRLSLWRVGSVDVTAPMEMPWWLSMDRTEQAQLGGP